MNKNFEENSHSVEKIERGPLVSSGFLGYVKVNTERGPFALSLPCPYLALVVSGVSLKSGPIRVRSVV